MCHFVIVNLACVFTCFFLVTHKSIPSYLLPSPNSCVLPLWRVFLAKNTLCWNLFRVASALTLLTSFSSVWKNWTTMITKKVGPSSTREGIKTHPTLAPCYYQARCQFYVLRLEIQNYFTTYYFFFTFFYFATIFFSLAIENCYPWVYPNTFHIF